MMKRWMVMLAVVLVVAPMAARADEAAKQAKVKELFAVMHMDHSMDRMRSTMEQQVRAAARNVSGTEQMTPEKTKAQQDFVDSSMKVVDANFGWPVLEPAYIKLYTDTFTEPELDGMLAFYKSPAGQAMLVKTPEVSAGVMQIMHSRMGDFQPKMQELQEQYVKQMGGSAPAKP